MDNKTFNKYLSKRGMKGLLKLCKPTEKPDLIFVYMPGNEGTRFLGVGKYQDEKDKIPENAVVSFVRLSNLRNKIQVAISFQQGKFGADKNVKKKKKKLNFYILCSNKLLKHYG